MVVPESVWQRMGQLTLQQGPVVTQYSDPETAARDLQAAFHVLDVGAYRSTARTAQQQAFNLRSGSYRHGEVVINTFAGTGLHSHLRSDTLAFFVLPGRGIGHYRLLGERINVTAGETVGYLPPCEFAVTNTLTGGTLIGFSLASLQRRIGAIGGDAEASTAMHPELLRPALLTLTTPQQAFLVHTILNVLELLDEAARLSDAPPSAALALDDVILRSIAMLLAPAPSRRLLGSPRNLNAAVDLAMSWMMANLHCPISLTDIEQQVGYGRRALQAGFRARTGCGPMQWLRRQRLEAAHGLLQARLSGGAAPTIAEVGPPLRLHQCVSLQP